MVSKAFTEGFYNKPRIDVELLKKHSEGLIALSACLAGEIPKSLLRNDYEDAKEKALLYICSTPNIAVNTMSWLSIKYTVTSLYLNIFLTCPTWSIWIFLRTKSKI